MDFKSLKKNSKSNFEALTKEIEKQKKGSFTKDSRFWELTVDKTGNGLAIIRFLPAAPDDDFPFNRYHTHSVQGPGGWYIENCLTSLGTGTPDPMCEENNKCWNSGSEAQQDIARARKRTLIYVGNIYVIQDKANPEAEGKRWLFKYGLKIYQKAELLMHPDPDSGEAPINPYDLWNGADFILKCKMTKGTGKNKKMFRNYDDSKFKTPSALLGGDDKALEALWKSEYSLKEFTDPKKFKSYDELKAKVLRVLGSTVSNSPNDFKTPQDIDPINPDFGPRNEPDNDSPLDGDDGESNNFFASLTRD